MGVVDHFAHIIKTVLDKNNRRHFEQVLSDTKTAYKTKTEQRKESLQKTPEWEVPKVIHYGKNYAERTARKSVMQPFYVATHEPKTEKAFIKLLEESPKVQWWYKNGEGESKYFAVPYSKDGEDAPFYVDFIVCFTNGDIGLYDTKSGITLREAGPKSDGLLAYINAQNWLGKKLHGAIIAPQDPRNYDAGWKVYTGEGASIASPHESPDNWEWLNEL